ncbi:hypothetical protein PoB_004846800 [Plakobranchus ocellatus]|uniref:Transporter n=1 Tax=Plakobranchus ocellatus TaxID=259542 RepID=A0AAV4BS36_9GAST|nr:hypothetical protein PoB_004846800 [Plakobranchus ocellatus]
MGFRNFENLYCIFKTDTNLSVKFQESPPAYSTGNQTGPGINSGHGQSPADAIEGELEPQPGSEDRGQWGNKAEFILSCVGLSVGLGNVWRFPYIAYENGGAAFLVAYFVLQLLIGKPMYFMELVMGQFSAKGPTKVWEMNPSAKGIGIAMCIISLIVAVYYNVIMAYTLYFFFSSMQKDLPWTECKEEWIIEDNCVEERRPAPPLCTDNSTEMALLTACTCTNNATIDSALENFNCTRTIANATTAAELFFEREVIQRSVGVEPENMGEPLWRLTLCLLLSWLVVVFCLIKGIKSSGKVVYFTATFPYIILLILLVRGCLLDGAIDGIDFLFVPKWDKLTDLDVWVAAAGQMFFSLSVSFGGIIMYGSYNRFRNQVYYDALFISIMDLVTSVIAGFVVFTTLGGMAKTIGSTVDQVAKGGYALAFVVYPEALSNLPPPQLWSILFFFMLFTLGLDSEFGLMETVLTCLQDEFPKTRKYKSYICVGLGISCFLLALPCVCPGGDYVVTIMDHYGADFSVLFLSCFEVISVMWVYGVMRFIKDIEYMLGSKPHGWPYWVFCWSVTSPVLIALLVTYRMINYSSPQYPNDEDFPEFAQAIGWILLAVALSPVPLWFIYLFLKSYTKSSITTFRERMNFMFAPTDQWVPADGKQRYLLPDGAGHGPAYPMYKTGIDNPAIIVEK